jgi:hypothetical protein
VRLDDRLGLWAVTYLLFFVKLEPGLALFLVLVFAIWIGWRRLCRKCRAVAWAVCGTARAELRRPQPRAFPALVRAQCSSSPQKSRLRVKTSAA